MHGAALEQEKCRGLTHQNFVSGVGGVQQPFPYSQVSSVSFFKKAVRELAVPTWCCELGVLDGERAHVQGWWLPTSWLG